MPDPIHPPARDSSGPYTLYGGPDTTAPPADPPKPGPTRNRWWSPDTRRTPDRPCLNCGNATVGNFCPQCGQRKTDVRVSMSRMLLEVLDDQLSLNSALPRTITSLLFRPGHLTSEYVQGRIVRYIPPFRIYLVASLLFFIVLPWVLNVDRIADQARDRRRQALAEDSVAAAAKADSARATGRTALRAPAAAVKASPRTPGDSAAAAAAARDTVYGIGVRQTKDGPQINLGVKDTAKVPVLLRPINRHLLVTEERLRAMPTEEVIRLAMRGFLENLPTAVFLMMPAFALILKVLYFRRKRFYVEHFVFALHVHAFAFLIFTVMLVGPTGWHNPMLQLWFAIYLYWAMKRVYGQGWLRTLIKFSVLGWTYMFLMLIGMMATGLATALMM